MAAENTSNFARGSNFRKTQAKRAYYLLNFKSWELKSLKSLQTFKRFMIFISILLDDKLDNEV